MRWKLQPKPGKRSRISTDGTDERGWVSAMEKPIQRGDCSDLNDLIQLRYLDLAQANWSETRVEPLEWKIKQILYGRNHTLRFTMFVATVEKMGQLPEQKREATFDAARG